MKRVCFLLKVSEDRVQDYLAAHEPVWPEMLDAIREAGIHNFSLFYRPDGMMVGYFEAEDPQESMRKLGATDVNRRWQEHMAPYFAGGSGDLRAGGTEWLTPYFYTA